MDTTWETRDPAPLARAVWDRLAAAVTEAGNPWRTPVVATRGPDGPTARVVVLRGVDVAAATLEFHTDARSPKVVDLGRDPGTAWVFYDAADGVQVRAEGPSEVLRDGPLVRAAWERVPNQSRTGYRTLLPPGAVLDGMEREAGLLPSERHHFAMVITRVMRWDWLWLAAPGGHRRAGFEREGDSWRSAWRVP